MYATSVEELIARPLMEMSEGRDHRFHGMGREDIDARMLGNGRPFVVEILSPRSRTPDLRAATERIHAESAGRVEVVDLKPCPAAEVRRVKEEAHDKSYRVVIRGQVPEEKIIDALHLLSGQVLAQRTPVRVAHRRADLTRHRTIRKMEMVEKGEGTLTLEIRAQAGTYVKEFVTGDGGRTVPSLSAALGVPLEVVSLDVMQIHDEEGE